MMSSQQSRRPVTHLYSNWHDNETIISFNVCKRNHFSLYLVGMLSSRGLLFLGSERNLGSEDEATDLLAADGVENEVGIVRGDAVR
jgi:hypothetical protein